MLKIENTEVLGWEAAIRGMRNPMNSWEKSDSYVGFGDVFCCDCGCKDMEPCGQKCLDLGTNDLDLMTRLRNAGTDHRKFMRMIVVYCDITAPLYWWKEFDTYKVGTVANSCSTMHKIAAKEFTLEDFSHEHLFDDYSLEDQLTYGCSDTGDDNFCYTSKDALQVICDILNHHRFMYLETKDKKYWWQMIQLLPSSYNQRRTVMLNYEVLANIYKSRRNHKLDEWRELCAWIEGLPYAELIVGSESKRFVKIAEDFQKAFQKGLEEGMSIRIQKENVDPEARELIEKALTEDMSLGFDKE